MCKVRQSYVTLPGERLIDESIYHQIKEGNYETGDYLLIDTNGEIQAVSGNSDFWEDGVVPRKDYIAIQVVRFIHSQQMEQE